MRSKRAKQRNSGRRLLVFAILIIMAIFIVLLNGLNSMNLKIDTNGVTAKSVSLDDVDPSQLYSQYAVLIDMKSGEALFSKKADTRCYPASLTKIMTAIVAIEESDGIDKTCSLSDVPFEKLHKENASMAGYRRNDKTTLEDLLYGCLLSSGADASIGIAQNISGSENKFVKLMNEKAKDLKLNDTHFENTIGLHHKNHYTTAEDMAKLLKYALKNPAFTEIFTDQSKNIRTSGREFTVHSTFFENYINKAGDFEVIGAKTGTTSDAGQCLASCVKKDNSEYILITMGAPIGSSSQPFSFEDMDYVFENMN